MSYGFFEHEIRELRAKIGRFRERAAGLGEENPLTDETLAELSNAVEELRVSSEELSRQHLELEILHREHERERLRYQDLFEAAPDGYVVTDLEGRVVEANDAAVRLLQVPLSTLQGTLFVTRVASRDVPRWTQWLHSSHGVGTAELHLRRRGERSFPAAITRTTISGDGGTSTGFRWSIQSRPPDAPRRCPRRYRDVCASRWF